MSSVKDWRGHNVMETHRIVLYSIAYNFSLSVFLSGKSIVHHDVVPLSTVPFGYTHPGEFHVPIRYDVELEQVVALIESSKRCEYVSSIVGYYILIQIYTWQN